MTRWTVPSKRYWIQTSTVRWTRWRYNVWTTWRQIRSHCWNLFTWCGTALSIWSIIFPGMFSVIPYCVTSNCFVIQLNAFEAFQCISLGSFGNLCWTWGYGQDLCLKVVHKIIDIIMVINHQCHYYLVCSESHVEWISSSHSYICIFVYACFIMFFCTIVLINFILFYVHLSHLIKKIDWLIDWLIDRSIDRSIPIQDLYRPACCLRLCLAGLNPPWWGFSFLEVHL